MTQWYYAKDSAQFGPVEFEQLLDLARRGELRADDLVWAEGMTDWREARTVEGMFADPPAAPAPQPAHSAAPAPRPARTAAPRRHASRRRHGHLHSGQTPGVVIGGFVASIVCLLTCAPTAVVGAILCYSGLEEARRRNAGVGLAIAGIVVGILGALIGVLLVVALFGFRRSF